MDEARRLLARLERIDVLRREGAPADALLAEVRGLLREGERWLAAEQPPEAVARARAALEECRDGLAAGEEVVAAKGL